MKKKNAFFTFCFACIPGAGSMYLGYMKRGLSQLLLLCVIFTGSVVLRFSSFAFLLPVVFAYCFFDTWHLRDQTPEQAAVMLDDYIIKAEQLGSENIKMLMEKRHTMIGWGCIAVAVILGYNNIFRDFLWRFADHLHPVVLFFFDAIPTLLLVAALVLLGIYLMRGPRAFASSGTASAHDEYVSYTGTHADNAAAIITQIADQAEVSHDE